MQYDMIVTLLLGYFVQEFFTSAKTGMNTEQYDRLLAFAKSQIDLWNEGVRDSRMHDTTLAALSALEDKDMFVENDASPDTPYIADSGMDQFGDEHTRCNKCGKWDIYCDCKPLTEEEALHGR